MQPPDKSAHSPSETRPHGSNDPPLDGPADERIAESALFGLAHRTCPGCSAEMVDRGCKLRCLRCGFFLDCSDG